MIKKTSEILGYGAEERLLIINIDDFGFCHTANESAIFTLRNGIASSLTIMIPCPWSLNGIKLLKENPDITFGIHLTVISEHEFYRWGPMCSPEEVSSLIDDKGFFASENDRGELIDRANVKELEKEFRKQIETVLNEGLKPTHMDSHCNIHDSRKDIFDMTFSLAEEYGLAIRVHDQHFLNDLKNSGNVVIDYPDLDSFSIPTKGKVKVYEKLLRELPPGLSEWAIHPAAESDELKTITPDWPVRVADFRFFNSEKAKQIIKEEGIEIITYKELQKYW